MKITGASISRQCECFSTKRSKVVMGELALKYGMKPGDYRYCRNCEMFLDLHLESECGCGDRSKWRVPTDTELENCVQNCINFGCFEEQGI